MALARKIRSAEVPQESAVNSVNTILANHNIPTDSSLAAVQYCNNEATRISVVEQATIVSELVGEKNVVRHQDKRLNKYTFLYLMQEAIRAASGDDKYDIQTVYKLAQNRAAKFIVEYPWVFAGADGVSDEQSSNPNAPKKGWKQEKAAEIYQIHKGKSRKELIEIFSKELDMTAAGASTYVAMCKRKFG